MSHNTPFDLLTISGKLPAHLPATSGKLRVMSRHCHTHTNFRPTSESHTLKPDSVPCYCSISIIISSYCSIFYYPQFYCLVSVVFHPLSRDSLFPILYISTLSCMYSICSNIDLRNHCLLDSLSLLVIVSSTLNSALRTSELRLTSELRQLPSFPLDLYAQL